MATIRTTIMVNDMMSQQFRAMNMAMTSVISSFQNLQNESSNAIDTAALEAAQRELQLVESRMNEVEQEIRQAENAQENLNRDFRQADQYAHKLLGTLATIAGTYLTIQGVGNVFNLSDEMTNTQARLNILLDEYGTQQTLDNLEKMIFDSSQRAYSSYLDTAAAVSKLGILAGDSFSNTDELIAFTELMNKNFAIGGASIQEQTAAMYQLTQAMASGKLQGDEFRSIRENAPLLAKSIEDYMINVKQAQGTMKDWSAEGALTADVIKGAMFSAAEETNALFNSMPLTWAQVWNNFKNDAIMIFQAVLEKLNQIANDNTFHSFVEGLKQSLYTLAQISLNTIQVISSIGGFMYENWSIISPLLQIVGSGLLALATYFTIAKIAAFALTAQQWSLNAAMMANPVGFVIAALVILIGLFYAAIAIINHFAGTSISATGLIAAGFAYMYTTFYNVISFMLNLILIFAEFWVNVWSNPVYTIKRLFANLANNALDMATGMIGSFDSAATNLANMFIDGANMAITAINWVIDALNNIPGIDLGNIGEIGHRTSLIADYSGLKSYIDNWVGETPENYWEAPRIEYQSPFDNMFNAYNWGANLFSGFEFAQSGQQFDMNQILNGLKDANAAGDEAAKDTAGNTKKLADSANMAAEDLAYLRDAANAEAINRFTTASIKVDMKNENHINSEMDIDGIVHQLVEKTEESMDAIAEGV